MLDLDRRVVAGLRELADRAPVDADVWPAAERYVAKHRKRHLAMTSIVVAIVVLGGAIAAVGLTRPDSRAVVSEDPTAPLPVSGPIVRALAVTAGAGGSLTFTPDRITLHTGVYDFGIINGSNAQHTLDFADPSTLWSPLTVNTLGEEKGARIFLGRPGDYTFFCSVPGHRAAGMEGVIHVTGEPMTLEQADKAATGYSY